MDRPPGSHTDWWVLSVEQHREIRDLRATLEWVGEALPVLRSMCEVQGWKRAAEKAREMMDAIEAMRATTIAKTETEPDDLRWALTVLKMAVDREGWPAGWGQIRQIVHHALGEKTDADG